MRLDARRTYPDVTVICGHIRRAPDDEHAASNVDALYRNSLPG
jgi:hypothetical protein